MFELEREISRDSSIVVDSAFRVCDVVPWQKAISFIVAKEGNVLIPRSDGSLIRSAYLSFPKPLVVSLNTYIYREIQKINHDDPATRSMIFIRDDHTCVYCNKRGTTLDHILPKSRGGKNIWSNLAVACLSCNGLKGNHTPEEIGWTRPEIPNMLVSRRKEKIQSTILNHLESMV